MSEFINLAARDATAQDLVKQHLARAWSAPQYTPEQEAEYKLRIKSLLKQHNAVLVAHYYTDPLIQALAEETGGCVSDSLEMARFGKNHAAETLIVAGVKFMGETAKILTPEKRVLFLEKPLAIQDTSQLAKTSNIRCELSSLKTCSG